LKNRYACLPAALIAVSVPGLAQTAPPAATPTPVAAPAPAPEDAGPVLTLDEAVAIAVQNNELVGQNQEAVQKYRARVREAKGQGLPQVHVNASYLRQKSAVAEFPSQYDENGVPTAFNRIVITPDTSKTASAGLTQVIDIFGLVGKARDIARLGERVQRLNVLRSQSEVAYQAKTAYYGVLRAQGAVNAAQAAVDDATEQLRLAKAFVAAGTSAQFDVTRAEVTLADRQQTLITAQDNVGLAGAALNNVLARDVDTPVNLAPLDVTPDPDVDIAGQTARALESRPEILQADLGVRINQDNVDIQKKGNYPTFSLSANYNYNFTAAGLNSNKGNYNYGVNMAWPIWDSGVSRAQVDEARSDTRVAQLQKKQLTRGVTLEVRQAGLRVQETANRFGVADKAVASAAEALRLARVRYQNGVATQLEVIDAETQLTQARFNQNNALYDYLTARADFDAALLGRIGNASGATGAGTTSTTSTSSLSTGATSAGGVGGSFNPGAQGTTGGQNTGGTNQGF
jgi:outer membrane protein TolC